MRRSSYEAHDNMRYDVDEPAADVEKDGENDRMRVVDNVEKVESSSTNLVPVFVDHVDIEVIFLPIDHHRAGCDDPRDKTQDQREERSVLDTLPRRSTVPTQAIRHQRDVPNVVECGHNFDERCLFPGWGRKSER